ncbi:lysozyme [Aromatoleum anaerobium]|uniref:Lysozyme n=1 Tax=Aromatoleum anaerobium TaxID=182180 RepID=A0ABX1PPC7_9RHOO|nr:lysozyme [Aromatoleum anaerobium]MCK0507901.1 lysozyme [Aromatoleum anaerobium]
MRARIVVTALSLSATGFVGLMLSEGYTDTAVRPTPLDVPTIGFGTTGGVKLGDRTTPPQALERALRDITQFEGALKRCVKVPLHQAEYDLYVDFSYNVGATQFCGSRLVKKLNAQDYRSACEEFPRWKYHKGFDCSTPGNRICAGLWNRRLDAREKCLAAQQED